MSNFEKVDLPAPLGPHTRVELWVLGSSLIELAISEIALFHSGGENSSCMMLLLGTSSEVQSWTCQYASYIVAWYGLLFESCPRQKLVSLRSCFHFHAIYVGIVVIGQKDRTAAWQLCRCVALGASSQTLE